MEKVLIVDDSKTICQILVDLMNSLGYENKTATDGLQALIMLKEEKFSVVISDIEMPGVDGLTLIKKIKENSPEIDVISITGFGTKYSYSEVIKTGASDFIVKPFGIDEIVAKLNRIFRERSIKRQLEEKNAELLLLSINDDLTGLYNRRHFYNQLEKEIIRARRQNRILFLVMLDLDEFKKFNDTYGHLEGDRVLKEVGRAINKSIRKNVDEGFRYGGDEFTVIIPEANKLQTMQIAQRIQEACRAIKPLPIEISLGLAELTDDHDVESFVHCADQAMYQAKNSSIKILIYGKISDGNITLISST
ncbi:MAG: diguanylate cyclase [Thermodesulfobacteriota bacterium]|jgi:diguanylate cyclase (GGDEF)-like protein|nr:MAG: diguanylate cyclase [Thermodesulfobacteriota bacterium]